MRVKKRDGRIVDFNPENIKRTIQYAAQAVEVRDLDFQTHAEEFNDLVKQLMKSGVQLEEARDLAEDQISGYILDGVYTEFDGDEADEVVDFVVESLDSSGKDIVDVELIQDVIENALISTGHKKTAKEYITRRAQRDRARDMNSRLMKSFEGITFKNSIDNDTKRENANIDGDSAMGTMLKYGSESAKEFNLLYLVSPDIADAHRSGDIHIHDLDFAALTETCVVKDTRLSIKNTKTDGELTVSAAYFDKFLDKYPVDTVVTLDNFKIMSGDRYVNLVNCVRHSSDGKRVLQIETEYGKICVTSEHKIPVVRNGKVMVLKAEEIVAGDELQVGNDIPMVRAKDTQKVVDIRDIEYSGYVYDFETEDHYFNANGFRVHNCVQIDLLKLFKGGFNTGHGFLREPQDIRTAGALACIAIQSSQNDMHSVA